MLNYIINNIIMSNLLDIINKNNPNKENNLINFDVDAELIDVVQSHQPVSSINSIKPVQQVQLIQSIESMEPVISYNQNQESEQNLLKIISSEQEIPRVKSKYHIKFANQTDLIGGDIDFNSNFSDSEYKNVFFNFKPISYTRIFPRSSGRGTTLVA